MKKDFKRVLSLMLVSFMVLTSMPAVSYGQTASGENRKSDPFELMVDTTPDLMTVAEIIQSTSKNSVRKTAMSDIVLEPSDYDDLKTLKKMIQESAEELIQEESELRIDEVLLDEILNQQKQLIEQSKTDRYIIKYNDDVGVSFKEQLETEIENIVEIKNVIPQNLNSAMVDNSETSLTQSERITKNISGGIALIDESSDKTELVILEDRVNPSDFAETLADRNVKRHISYIQPDYKMELNSTGVEQITKEKAQLELDDDPSVAKDTTLISSDKKSGKTLVAVIDTGIDITHPDLKNFIYNNPNEIPNNGIDEDGNGYVDDVNGWNFVDDSRVVYEASLGLDQAHGTHISGIIAGLSDADEVQNNNVEILPLKVFHNGTAYTSDIIAAIEYAQQMGVTIVNCSFGSTYDNPALKEAMNNSDMLFICSSGNARTDLEETPVYPASFDLDNVLSVTSANRDGGLSYFSNYSSALVDVAALGRDVNSTLPNGEYGRQSGTSMSTAIVSGIAAAVQNTDQMAGSIELKQRLLNTADKLSNLQETIVEGRRINSVDAISNISKSNVIQNQAENDFDINGYDPTYDQLYNLFASGVMTKVAAGDQTSLVLKSDGTVWAWGDNVKGQCGNGTSVSSVALSQVIGLTNVIGIAAGSGHALAVKSDGTVWSWGDNSSGQLGNGTTTSRTTPAQVTGLTGVASVSAGSGFSMALKTDGTVWVWGNNSSGQLGDGTTTNKTTPVRVTSISSIVSISAGYYHSLAVKSDGTVWAWGNNSYGQLGDGTTAVKTTPVRMGSLTGVTSASGGLYSSLVVKSDGTVWGCGYNLYYNLGDGTKTNRSTPVQVSTITGVTKVAAGNYHSAALKSDGTVWAWGENGSGQAGDGTTTDRTTPVRVSSLTGIENIAASFDYNIALKSGGTVWAWGDNQDGQLGDGKPSIRLAPIKISALSGMTGVAAGDSYSFGLKSGGTVWSWGDNPEGQLGIGTTVTKSAPTQITSISGASGIAAKYYHGMAAKSDGTALAWGYNSDGQLGDGTTTDRMAPVQVSGLTGTGSVAVGGSHSLALKTAGTVWAWGYNSKGQLGNGTTTDKTTPVQVSNLTGILNIAAGDSHSIALKSGGTVWTWGRNNDGQIGDGSTTNRLTPVQVSSLTGIVGIAAGEYHNLAVKSDGTVWAWGRNDSGQIGDGTTTNRTAPVKVSGLTGVVRVAAGQRFSLAVKSDGTVWAWGNNNSGQLGDGTTVNKATPVQVSGLTGVQTVDGGYDHCLALKTDGTVWGWGSDESGQLGQARVINSSVPIQSQAYVGAMNFNGNNYNAEIPVTGQTTIIVSASGNDAFGNTIPMSSIQYSLATAYPGVSVNSTTGLVTISSSAQAGNVQIKAAYQSLNCITTIALTVPPVVVVDNTYEVPLRVNDITSFTGRTYTLTYNSSVLEPIDLCMFTNTKEIVAGIIPGTGITISEASAGKVVIIVDKAIPSGKKWSGVINTVQFKIKTAGGPNINFVSN